MPRFVFWLEALPYPLFSSRLDLVVKLILLSILLKALLTIVWRAPSEQPCLSTVAR
jgi:hypothetical protein